MKANVIPWVLVSLGAICIALFIFPGIEIDGPGPISIGGSTPYEKKVKISLGAFKRPWASLSLEDKYDGKDHNSKIYAGCQNSYVFLFGPVGVTLLAMGLLKRKQSRPAK